MDYLLALAVLPGFVLMLFFYCKDKHEPEPREVVLRMMGWGASLSIFAIGLELPLQLGVELYLVEQHHPYVTAFASSFIVAALVEESLKFWAVKRKIYHDPNLDEPYDGIVYCVAVSLGFAIVENILYVFSGGFVVGVMRALLAIPAHALFGVFMGYFVGLSKFREPPVRGRLQATGLLIAILAHGTYNFVLLTEDALLQLTVFPIMGVFWIVALIKVHHLVSISPHKERPESSEQEVTNSYSSEGVSR